MSTDRGAQPSAAASDVLHATVRAGLGSVPVLGAAAAELFSLVIAPPLERRRREWLDQLAGRIAALEGAIQSPQQLASNEEFIDAVVQASQIAIGTHNQTKLQSLQNAVVNVASGQSPDSAERQLLFQLIANFTEWHIKLIDLFENPERWFRANNKVPPGVMMGSLAGTIFAAFPELSGRVEFLDNVWRDLKGSGLVDTPDVRTMMTAHGTLQPRLTERGRVFRALIMNGH